MGMEINATVVVQIFNFFGAYFLLKTLFFKPAVKILQQEQEEKDHLTTVITNREDGLRQTADEKKLAWKGFQHQFEQAAPLVNESCIHDITVQPIKEKQPLTDEQIDTLAHQVCKKVVKKVSNVQE